MPETGETRKEPALKAPERVTATEAYRNFADIVDRARYGGERFIITQHGEDAAAIVGVNELREVA